MAGIATSQSMITLDSRMARYVDESSNMKIGIYSLGFVKSCTGVQISRQGHVLTARHCIESSVAQAEILAKAQSIPFTNSEQVASAPSLERIDYNSEVLRSQLQIPVGLDGGTVYGTVYSVGPGELNPRFTSEILDPSARETHARLADLGYSDGGDFAIVLIPALKDRKCLKLATQPIELGESVQTVSYPCLHQDAEWPQVRRGNVNFSSAEDALEMEDFRLTKGNFLISHGAVACNSGSPVFNSRGEIAGVLHTTFSSGSSMVLHTEHALALMNVRDRRIVEELNESCSRL